MNSKILIVTYYSYYFFFLATSLSIVLSSCSSDDDSSSTPALEAWEIQVNQLRTITSQYADITVATDEGRIDVSGYVPNMGNHYLKGN